MCIILYWTFWYIALDDYIELMVQNRAHAADTEQGTAFAGDGEEVKEIITEAGVEEMMEKRKEKLKLSNTPFTH